MDTIEQLSGRLTPFHSVNLSVASCQSSVVEGNASSKKFLTANEVNVLILRKERSETPESATT